MGRHIRCKCRANIHCDGRPHLRVGQKARNDIAMQVGTTTTEVTVEGTNIAQVETQSSDLSGTVTKARWTNPHSWLYFDVKGPDGSVTNWGVEFGAPNNLEGNGLKKADLQAGAKVHIQGYRSKNGGPFGYSVTVTLEDGRTFKTGGAQDAPARTAQMDSAGRNRP